MNTEKLIAKGVKKHFNGQIVLFAVASLLQHFDGLQFHDSDKIEVENWEGDELLGTEEFIKASDVNFDDAVAKEVATEEEETLNPVVTGMTYENAEKELKLGNLIALPEWGGFWFKNLNVDSDEVLVLTKEGEITNTPFEEFKERNDWVVVDATSEQEKLLENYFASLVVTETVGVDAKEVIEDSPEPSTDEIIVNEAKTLSTEAPVIAETSPLAE